MPVTYYDDDGHVEREEINLSEFHATTASINPESCLRNVEVREETDESDIDVDNENEEGLSSLIILPKG